MEFEKYNWLILKEKNLPIVGVDEVGRGCLAGSVYAAAAIINTEKEYKHYTDSKKISEKRRDVLSEQILSDHQVGIGFASVQEIEDINILQASLLAMKRAVEKLNLSEGILLIDGNKKIPNMHTSFEQITLVKGDFRAEPIAAASIVAKVTRDNEIKKMSELYPGYGFEKHKGYATKLHKEAIKKWGPCEIHRKTFAGVKEFL